MDPGGSELDSSLPQSENPCLIVEDSQPDSVALEDDPESSYRALLARRLSSLQPTARSPVLELISSPLGSLCSQTDSQSESPSRPPPEESQVLNVCPPPSRAEDPEMDPGADSTTNCVQSEGGSSQFGFLELSQSQDLRAEDAAPPLRKPAEQTPSGRAGGRSEVSSSSSSESQGPAGRKLTVQALLHSQNQDRDLDLDRDLDQDRDRDQDQDQQDCEILSSQEDLFDAERTGSAVDSTVSEPEQPGPPTPTPTPTPAATLRLLHLSGQKTLVQESLSQSSVDFVAPTPEGFPPTPVIVPSSPTDLEKDQGADEPMDTSLPPDSEKDEPMETEAAFSKPHPPSGPHPASSTPVSQKPPGLELDRTPSVPSQPEFSHDVFVPTQSPEAPPQPGAKPASPPPQLSANSEGQRTEEEEPEEDSQATQIEEPEEEKEEEEKEEEEPKASEDKHSLEATRSQVASGSQPAPAGTPSDGLVQETPSSSTTSSITSSITSSSTSATTSFSTACTLPSQSGVSQPSAGVKLPLETPASQSNHEADREEEEKEKEEEEQEEEVVMEAENTGGEASGLALVLSQSQMLSPEPMEEDALTDGQRNSQLLEEDGGPRRNAGGGGGAQPGEGGGGAESPKLAGGGGPQLAEGVGGSPQLAGGGEGERGGGGGGGGGAPASTNGLASQSRDEEEQAAGAEPEGLGDRSLGDSSGDISFHFTLPKEGELIGPASGATPPLLNQLKQTLRHSTPIEVAFSEKPDAAGGLPADVLMTTSGITPGDGEDAGGGADGDAGGGADGKLSLRMRLVTPVEEGSSERFSLQKPNLAEEDASVVKVTASSVTVTSSPSVFTRVRQVLRQPEAEEDDQPDNSRALLRGELFGSPQRSSPASPGGSQSEAPQREKPEEGPGGGQGPPAAPEPPPPKGPGARQKGASPPSSQARQRGAPQQSSFQASGLRSPPGREPESPAFRRAAAVSHRRHVRTIQEVRTTITRIITDVYYEDGKEVERKVTEESEEPVLDCQVLDSDVSPSRTGCSSVTSGDLADVSSPSSKASSLQHSSGGPSRPGFAVPPSRGARNDSPRRGGGHPQRGHRGHRSGSEVSTFVPLSPRGRARRGRPPSRSPPTRGAGVRSPQRLGAPGPPPPPSSSEDEPFARTPGPRPPAGRHSDSPEAGSSFVGLRVVAKWASNGYFYSGRIVGDDGGEGRGVEGEGRFRLRFDDGYECEVAARDVLLCDPIPLEAEVTALLEDQYFSTGVVKGHKIEGQDLFYSVEKEGQRRWYSRAAVILSLEQGNRLREQHSLGPYQPSTPLAKASDISLDNLVDGKRRRRGPPPGGADTPNRSPRTPSGKRKLTAGEESRTPSKRGRRGGGVRAAQRPAPCTSSGSGSELPPSQSQVASTHGPMPPNASLFMGFAFMLTAASARDRESNRTLTEEEEGEGEEGYVQTGPYNKAYTESQLEAGGGFILPHFNEEQCKAAYQSLLIADQHCRTRKYLLCLAAGVPPVSHLWVRDCCLHNKLLNYRSYLLPAGHGPHSHMVEWHPRCQPFRGLRVLLVVQVLEELWSQLLLLGGASSVQQLRPPAGGRAAPAGTFDLVVADGPAPPLDATVPLASPEWLVHSVICGERLEVQNPPEPDQSSSS